MPRLLLRPRRRPRSNTRPQVEVMEARQLLATIVVTGTGDTIASDGIVTLREAITAANTNAASGDATAGDAGHDTIAFDIPGDGVQVITVQSPLPSITDPLTIDGYTQHGASANTLATGSDAALQIEVDGPGFGGDITGFTLDAGDSTLRGLVIDRFTIGIIADSDRNLIAGNFIGVNAEGVEGPGNVMYYGIEVFSGAGNVVGGTSAAARNVVSGSIYQNITVAGKNTVDGASAPSATLIQGNYVGTNAAGTGRVDVAGQGQGAGIFLADDDGTLIGGTSALARNVISSNTNGIYVYNSTTNLTIQGNFIGVDATGSVALGNTLDGINALAPFVSGDTLLIGGTTPGAGNVISGNGYEGVYASSHNLVFQGNFVGTNAAGTAVIGNAATAVEVTGGDSQFGPNNALIGGTSAAARNVIAGNSAGGILIESLGEGTRLVQGNFIGTLADGTTPAGNLGFGIVSTTRATIGGAAAGAGNVIANNSGGGVRVGDSDVPSPTGVSILGNAIYNNAVVEIALLQPFTYPNDLGDVDAGANNYQNYPLVTSAVVTAGGAMVSGSLNSQPLLAYTIEFFSNVSLDPTVGNGKQTFLGRTMVTTGATGDVTFTANVAAPPAGQAIITATATDPDGNTSPFTVDPAVLSTPVTNSDLAVAVGDAPDPVNAGSNLTYTITVTNAGPDAAQDVTLSVPVPAGTTFLSFSQASGWSITAPAVGNSGGTISATNSALAATATPVAFTFVVSVDSGAANGSTISASASVASATTDDPDDANNTSGTTTTVHVSEQPARADLGVSVSDAPDPVAPGATLTYTITVTNDGPDAATNLALVDDIPAGTTFVSFTAPAGWAAITPAVGATGTVSATADSFASGAPGTFTLVVRVNAGAADGSTISDSAAISSTQSIDNDSDNDSDTATTTVAAATQPPPTADLVVTQSASPGTATVGQDAITFIITVTNQGPASASNATLTESLPVGATFVSATGGVTPSDGRLTIPLGELATGARLTFTVVVRPQSAGTLTASATASATEADPSTANNTATASAAALDPVITPPPPDTTDGPRIVAVHRFGIHAMPTTVVIAFDKPLGPASANVKNYRITSPGGVKVAVQSATYNASAHTVTLRMSKRISIHHPYKLVIRGTGPDGLTDAAARLLDGQRTGQPGSDYATTLTWRNLILPRWYHKKVSGTDSP